METPVKNVALPLSGAVATLTGVFIRSCTPDIPPELLTSFCGDALTSPFGMAAHAHCAGCALVASGAGMLALSALLHVRRRVTVTARIAR